MPKYNLNALTPEKFERLSQSLVQEIIGKGAKVYGKGRDGAREATFRGKAPYPSEKEQWEGYWVFQTKFHDVTQIGPKKARRAILQDLKKELSKVTEKFHHPCDNFILITNVSLSPVYQKGTKDKIDDKIIPKFKDKVDNIHVWGGEEVCRFLDSNPEIRNSYLDLLVPGDIIAALLGLKEESKRKQDELVKLYCEGCYNQEKYAALDDAGDIEEERISLQKLFIDLEVNSTTNFRKEVNKEKLPNWLLQASDNESRTSALSYLLDDSIRNIVITGGPGGGKTTLCQYLAQIHRSRLLDKFEDLNEDKSKLENCLPRLPFRILLRKYAEWVSSNDKPTTLFHYIAKNFSEISGRETSPADIQEIVKSNSTILMLDGLDEVPEKDLREEVMDYITTFINQVRETLEGDLRIVASTRPFGYQEEFDPTKYLYLRLQKISPEKAINYAKLWAKARGQTPQDKNRISNTFKKCLKDEVVNTLMETPLQVTILLVIIRAQGNLPKQREELFSKYMEVIYTREQKKNSELLRTDRDVIYGLHKYLAFLLQKRAEHTKTTALMDISEFRKTVESYLLHTEPVLNDEERKDKANKIIKEARERLVLIESSREGKVGFKLTTTREYFTAAHLVDTAEDTKQRDSRFKEIATSPHWRNVALFFAGRIGRTLPGEVPSLIDLCREVDEEGVDRFLRRGAELVIDMLEDRVVRRSHHQLGALKFGLTYLERGYIGNFPELINKLKSLDKEYRQRVIKPYLEEKLQKTSLINARPFFDTYKELFGLKKILHNILKEASQSEHQHLKLWYLRETLKSNTFEPYIKDLLSTIAESAYKEDLVMIVKKHIYDFKSCCNVQLPPRARSIFALSLLLQLKEDYPPWSSSTISQFKQELPFLEPKKLIDELMDENQTEENDNKSSLLFWGVSFTYLLSRASSSASHGYRNKKWAVNIYPPSLAHPKVKKLIEKKEKTIKGFCEVFNESREPFINLLVALFEFILEPSKRKKFVAVLEKFEKVENFVKEWGSVISYLLGPIRDARNRVTSYHKYLYSLWDNYTSEDKIKMDFRKLNEIINIESAQKPNHPMKISFWLTSKFNSDIKTDIKKHLDHKIMGKMDNWFRGKDISKNILSICNGSTEIKRDEELCRFALKIMNNELLKDQNQLGTIPAYVVSYDWQKAVAKEKNILEHLTQTFEKLLEYYSSTKGQTNKNLELLYWSMWRANQIRESHLSKIYKIAQEKDVLDIEEDQFPYLAEILKTAKIQIKDFLQSDDPKVRRVAAVSLLSLKENAENGLELYSNLFKEKWVSSMYWKLTQAETGDWQAKFIKGMSHCKIKWSDHWEEILEIIKNTNNQKNIKAWAQVISRSKLFNSRDKEVFITFLTRILDEKERFGRTIFVATLERLRELKTEIEKVELDKNELKLP